MTFSYLLGIYGYTSLYIFPTNLFEAQQLRSGLQFLISLLATHKNHSLQIMTSKPPHILSLNHHLAHQHDTSTATSDQQQQPSTCSRWNPTAEQLLALEELYWRGMRTPTAAQIQQIANRLLRLGKIEGKNVFYWFQNHKARERQKRRRLADAHPQLRETNDEEEENNNSCPKKLENQHDSVMRREGYKFGETKRRVRPLNCSKSSEVSNVSSGNYNTPDGWIQIQRDAISRRMSTTTAVSVYRTKYQDLNENLIVGGGDDDDDDDDRTLELFPVKGKLGINASKLQDTKRLSSTPNYQYIEFLPVKK